MPSPRLKRLRHVLIALVTAAAVTLGATQGARAYDNYRLGQAQLSSWQAQRSLAVSGYHQAITTALHDGVDSAKLAVAEAQATQMLSQSLPTKVTGFVDPHELATLQQQVKAFTQLSVAVQSAEAIDTEYQRLAAKDFLSAYSSSIQQAQRVSLDTSADQAKLDGAKQAIDAAASPNQIKTAIADLPNFTAALDTRTNAQIALLYAQALTAAQSDASGALAYAGKELTLANSIGGVDLGADPAAISQAHQAENIARLPDDFNAVANQANGAGDDINKILTERQSMYDTMSAARNDLQNRSNAGTDITSYTSQLDAEGTKFRAAKNYGDFFNVIADINGVMAPIDIFFDGGATGPGKVIDIRLNEQDLFAFQDGQLVYHTVITTGMPELATPTGHFSVLKKNSPWLMVTSYPYGSIGWYPSGWVTWVLWFTNVGHGIHDAPWRSDWGPGSNLRDGSHGCVNVPGSVMEQLYSWAPVGTPVYVIQG